MTPDHTPNPSDSHTNPNDPPTALDKEIQKINQDLLVATFEAMKAPQPTSSLRAMQSVAQQSQSPPTSPTPTTTPSTSQTPTLQTTDDKLQANPTPPQTDNIIEQVMMDIVKRDIALTQQRLYQQK